MLAARSAITTDEAGWTWLGPDRRSLALRHGAVSVAVSVLLVAAAAAATLPPPPVAVPALAAVVAVGAVLVRGTWRDAHTRMAVSALGVLVLSGTAHEQLGWPVILAVTGRRRGRRIRVQVATRTGTIAPAATFGAVAARAWLDEVAREAAARRLDPVPAVDGLGFVAGDGAG